MDNDCDGKIDETLSMPCGSSMVGVCKMGTQVCSAGQWSVCQGAVEPTTEVCDTEMLDEDCNGTANEGCECTASQPCGKQVGICKMGMQMCVGGKFMSACIGGVEPQAKELCDGVLDENCDGKVDEGCECTNGKSEECMPSGACSPGMRICADGKWGACKEAVTCASSKMCIGGQCVDCMDGMKRPCGKQLPSPCKQGTQVCRNGAWDPTCSGGVDPQPSDTCNGKDDDCDSTTDEGGGCSATEDCMGARGCVARVPMKWSSEGPGHYTVTVSPGYRLNATANWHGTVDDGWVDIVGGTACKLSITGQRPNTSGCNFSVSTQPQTYRISGADLYNCNPGSGEGRSVSLGFQDQFPMGSTRPDCTSPELILTATP